MNKNEFESQRISMIAGKRRILPRRSRNSNEMSECAKCYCNTLFLPMILVVNFFIFLFF